MAGPPQPGLFDMDKTPQRVNQKPRPEDRMPDKTKCNDQRSRDLRGQAPGDRGMCEKQSTTQGSE
jgi:hypothetical protein